MPTSQSALGHPYLSEGMQLLVLFQQHLQGVTIPWAELLPTGPHPESPGVGSINLRRANSVTLQTLRMSSPSSAMIAHLDVAVHSYIGFEKICLTRSHAMPAVKAWAAFGQMVQIFYVILTMSLCISNG